MASYESTAPIVPTVNFHLWAPCNMACGFCFARFEDVKAESLPKGHLTQSDAATVVEQLCEYGFSKINFAGGEPTLCPWLPDLLRQAKEHGLTTSIVTNGTRITTQWLDETTPYLNMLALSIDSINPDTLRSIGRAVHGEPLSEERYREMADWIIRHGIRLKVNTVVSQHNCLEDMTQFIRSIRPERWKLLQALPIAGQNDGEFEALAVTAAEFSEYVERNRAIEESGIVVVVENNTAMRGSYAMVDPAGRFFDNTEGGHRYSRPILEAGVAEALRDVSVDADAFIARGGLYN